MTKISTIFGIYVIIFTIIIVAIMVISLWYNYPNSPEETFKNDPSIIEYCYLIDDIKYLPVSNGRETRMERTLVMQKECVDRNLSVVSSELFDNSHNEFFMYWHKNAWEV